MRRQARRESVATGEGTTQQHDATAAHIHPFIHTSRKQKHDERVQQCANNTRDVPTELPSTAMGTAFFGMSDDSVRKPSDCNATIPQP
jgi:hypothetical protein